MQLCIASSLLLTLSVLIMEDAAAFVSLARRIGTPAFSATSSETPTVINRQSMVLAMGDTTETKSIEDISVELAEVKKVFDEKLSAAESVAAAEEIRREYLGKKGPINQVMGYMRLLPNDKKPKLGAVVNEIKSAVEEALFTKMEELKIADIERRMESERIDVTMPGIIDQTTIGHRHPLSMTIEKAVDIFTRLGYDTVTECADSPEIETDYYCFEALNCPKDHPARDMQDTFYLTNDMEYLLRTHTSSVQIRQLQKRKPPLRIVAPGRVYRRDDIDATHSLMFHQVEILALEEKGKLDLGHLKGTVEYFLKNMFGPDIQIRFRGSFFPFTEPSMEVDVFFRGKWLEVLGCGMVDPAVLEMAGIDPEKFSGFAAGFGVERFAMVIHNIKDIREFVKGDLRFLEQFPHFYDDGLETFLAGGEGAKPTDVEELRTEDIPPFIVTSDDQLRELKAKQEEDTAAAANQATEDSKNVEIQKTDEIDISKLDIRVGVIVKAWEHEEADKLFCEEIDIGEEKPRQIASGLRAHYNLDDLTGQRVLVLSNLKERRLVGFPSYGMVLCASVNGKVEFVEPPVGAVIGERVMVEGYDGEPATENQVIKKKMLDVIFPNLKTNQQGIATYNGVPFMTSAGPCRAQTGLANADVA